MTELIADPVVNELRTRAAAGAGVRELTHCIQRQLGTPPLAIVPVLAYFCRAFDLRLPVALPIREWLGTDNDAEIDALILPEIAANRDKWMTAEVSGNGEGLADGSVQECDQAALKK